MRPTLAQVAAEAGVSVATVSKVLHERPDVAPATRRRVRAALVRAGRPGPTRATDRPRPPQLEVVLPGIQSPYSLTVLDGVVDAARVAGFDVVLGRRTHAEDGSAVIESLLAADRAGAVLVNADLPAAALRRLHEGGLPFVVVDPAGDVGEGTVSVGATSFAGALEATEHLLALGHTRIAHAGGPPEVRSSQARAAGVAAALRRAGLPFEESLVTTSGFDYGAGRAVATLLLDRPDPPTAIVAGNDEIALGLIEEARRRGLAVPARLSVIGFDDSLLASRATPPLTTVAQPLAEMGRVAVQALQQLVAGTFVGTPHLELATRLVVRDSVGPPSETVRS